jgi:hypothetical protein
MSADIHLGIYPHMSPHCAGVRIGQLHGLYGFCTKIPSVCSRHRVKCGRNVAKLSGARTAVAEDNGQNFCRLIPHRATGTVGARRRNAAGMPAERKTPGVFHLHERGAGWSRTGPAHVPFPKSSIGGPAPIFWPNFLGKILEIKIVF